MRYPSKQTWIRVKNGATKECIPAIGNYLNLHSNDDTAEISYLLAEIISNHVGGWEKD